MGLGGGTGPESETGPWVLGGGTRWGQPGVRGLHARRRIVQQYAHSAVRGADGDQVGPEATDVSSTSLTPRRRQGRTRVRQEHGRRTQMDCRSRQGLRSGAVPDSGPGGGRSPRWPGPRREAWDWAKGRDGHGAAGAETGGPLGCGTVTDS